MGRRPPVTDTGAGQGMTSQPAPHAAPRREMGREAISLEGVDIARLTELTASCAWSASASAAQAGQHQAQVRDSRARAGVDALSVSILAMSLDARLTNG